MNESGISTYFNQDKIRIRFKTIEDLGYPEYIHLRINESKKQLFIEKCARDMDAFRIEYSSGKVKQQSCYINAKRFLQYMAAVIGVTTESPSLRFSGRALPDGRVFIDLTDYTVINYAKKAERPQKAGGAKEADKPKGADKPKKVAGAKETKPKKSKQSKEPKPHEESE